jgi:hypothetical protein
LIPLALLVVAATTLAACTLPYALLLEFAGDYHNTTSVADLDGDGDLDVLLHNRRHEAEFTAFAVATFWLNQGDAGFTGRRSVASTILPGWAAQLGDIDADGATDLVAFTGDRVHMAFGPAETASGAAPDFGSRGVALAPQSAAQFGDLLLGDLNGDGRLDGLVTGCCGRVFTLDPDERTPNFSWMWITTAEAQANLTPPTAALPALDGVAVRAAALGDLDGDGDLDLYAGLIGAPDRVLLNDGAGNFADSGQRLDREDSQGDSTAVALGDLDGDGDLDVVAGDEATVAVWRNQGGVQGGDPALFRAGEQTLPADRVRALFLADFDGDGALDALVAGIDTAAIWRNDGAGHFTDSGQRFRYSARHGLAVADLDGDALPDLFAAAYAEDARVWYNQGMMFSTGMNE